jgi:ribosomal protein L37AE/L43A
MTICIYCESSDIIYDKKFDIWICKKCLSVYRIESVIKKAYIAGDVIKYES